MELLCGSTGVILYFPTFTLYIRTYINKIKGLLTATTGRCVQLEFPRHVVRGPPTNKCESFPSTRHVPFSTRQRRGRSLAVRRSSIPFFVGCYYFRRLDHPAVNAAAGASQRKRIIFPDEDYHHNYLHHGGSFAVVLPACRRITIIGSLDCCAQHDLYGLFTFRRPCKCLLPSPP